MLCHLESFQNVLSFKLSDPRSLRSAFLTLSHLRPAVLTHSRAFGVFVPRLRIPSNLALRLPSSMHSLPRSERRPKDALNVYLHHFVKHHLSLFRRSHISFSPPSALCPSACSSSRPKSHSSRPLSRCPLCYSPHVLVTCVMSKSRIELGLLVLVHTRRAKVVLRPTVLRLQSVCILVDFVVLGFLRPTGCQASRDTTHNIGRVAIHCASLIHPISAHDCLQTTSRQLILHLLLLIIILLLPSSSFFLLQSSFSRPSVFLLPSSFFLPSFLLPSSFNYTRQMHSHTQTLVPPSRCGLSIFACMPNYEVVPFTRSPSYFASATKCFAPSHQESIDSTYASPCTQISISCTWIAHPVLGLNFAEPIAVSSHSSLAMSRHDELRLYHTSVPRSQHNSLALYRVSTSLSPYANSTSCHRSRSSVSTRQVFSCPRQSPS